MTLTVQVPTGLNAEAKNLLKQFDKLTGDSLGTLNGAAGNTKKKSFWDKGK